MTSNQIVEHLARQFETNPECVRATLEMVDAGLAAPFIGRVRRKETGGMPEGVVRRLDRYRRELEELDRRRATILRMLAPPASPATPGVEGAPARPASAYHDVDESVLERVRTCMDRFELEDQFLPHRRPEPEVQLALDRGLGHLADDLTRPMPRPERGAGGGSEGSAAATPEHELSAGESGEESEAAESAAESGAGSGEEFEIPEVSTPAADGEVDPHGSEGAAAIQAAAEGASNSADDSSDELEAEQERERQRAAQIAAQEALLHGQIALSPALARLCAPYVNPDKGVHTEGEALAGAMRILSDRLGRDPRVRSAVRRMLARQGVLSVRASDEARVGRHKPLLRVRQPLRQIQGQRLLAIRQAQKERAVSTVITLNRGASLPKVRASLGRHTNPEYASVLDAVALRTLEYRLLPLLDADVRLDLKERADDEALRFLCQRLRQMLLTPPLGLREVAGLDVSAKGDWTLAVLDREGGVVGTPQRIELSGGETGPKDAAQLGADLKAILVREERLLAPTIAIGQGKLARTALPVLRRALAAAGMDVFAHVVDEAGVASYAASEWARRELPDLTVPQRAAVSLGRRLQDPMNEILKVDLRHLSLGPEQGLVSKANLKRALDETVESCVAVVGSDVNRAPLSRLRFIPGLDLPTAQKIVERRATRPIESREELRAEGLLSEAQWTSAAGFLRVKGGSEPLDETALHPEQYPLVRSALEAAGSSPREGLGRPGNPGASRSLPRDNPDVDPMTWRDVLREVAFPGRDPRPFQQRPVLLDPQTDRVTLTKDRVVEGVVTSVASFGAFVDIGLDTDALVHVSEISDRYVRDARELISIGQTVRARILDGQPARIPLSLKRVPFPERPQRSRPERGPREGGGRDFSRGPSRGRQDSRENSTPEIVRAAQVRRDGLGGARGKQERGGRRSGGRPESGAGGRPGGGGGGGDRAGRGGPRGRGPGEDAEFRREDLEQVKKSPAHKPFAAFFKTTSPKAEP